MRPARRASHLARIAPISISLDPFPRSQRPTIMFGKFRLATLTLLFVSVAHAQSPAPDRTPVLVELFTSEGCSSCPPADALLAALAHDQPISSAEIIVLGEHVDYWDQLGWHDRFSSHQFTDRQNLYGSRFRLDSVYTPQMVVDGHDQFVGNDIQQAHRAITQAAQRSKLPLRIASASASGHAVTATLAPTAPGVHADIFAALVEPFAVTHVRSGENGGHTLQHVAVVRTLQRIGSLQDLAAAPLKFTLQAPESSDPASMRLVVFVQSPGQAAILGVTSSPTHL